MARTFSRVLERGSVAPTSKVTPLFPFKRVLIPSYGLLSIQELPTEVRRKSQLCNEPQRPSATFSVPLSLRRISQHLASLELSQSSRVSCFADVRLSRPRWSPGLPRRTPSPNQSAPSHPSEAVLEPQSNQFAPRVPRKWRAPHGPPQSIITFQLYVSVFLIHLLPLDPDQWGPGKDTFSLSLNVWETLL